MLTTPKCIPCRLFILAISGLSGPDAGHDKTCANSYVNKNMTSTMGANSCGNKNMTSTMSANLCVHKNMASTSDVPNGEKNSEYLFIPEISWKFYNKI